MGLQKMVLTANFKLPAASILSFDYKEVKVSEETTPLDPI